ncbi:MAG: hypothetical protein DMG14_24210, partial [Acidobacteria bacterium]
MNRLYGNTAGRFTSPDKGHAKPKMTNPRTTVMIETMSTVHMNENEVTANFAEVLEKVRHGIEVIVERNHQPVAIIRAPKRS